MITKKIVSPKKKSDFFLNELQIMHFHYLYLSGQLIDPLFLISLEKNFQQIDNSLKKRWKLSHLQINGKSTTESIRFVQNRISLFLLPCAYTEITFKVD